MLFLSWRGSVKVGSGYWAMLRSGLVNEAGRISTVSSYRSCCSWWGSLRIWPSRRANKDCLSAQTLLCSLPVSISIICVLAYFLALTFPLLAFHRSPMLFLLYKQIFANIALLVEIRVPHSWVAGRPPRVTSQSCLL